MLVEEQVILQQNALLEEEIEALKESLEANRNDLKYTIGLTVGKNLRPRKKIFGIPQKVRKLLREGMPIEEEMIPEEPYARNKYLQEQKAELLFYENCNESDIHYVIGKEIYNAQGNIGAMLGIPFRMWNIRRMNRRINVSPGEKLPPIEGVGESVLFVATNGVGLGHLTRCLSVARRMKKLRPETEIIFLTTSLALTVLQREGFVVYCIPSKMLIKNISYAQWNALLKNMMSELLQLYGFDAVIFDGALPFASVTAALAEEKDIPRIWIRRGSEKSVELMEQRDAAEKDFDYVIMPKEAGEACGTPDGKHISVPPIICLDKKELWAREDVRRYLKIPMDKIAVYIQLGAGNINNIDSDINRVVTELRKNPNIVMVLGESIIGNELKIIEDDIIVLKDYPNSKYFNGFDFAVSACGYNSFHELIYFGVPTIFIPNMHQDVDDQYARAMIAQNHDAGVVINDIGSDELARAIERMCDQTENARMRKSGSEIIGQNGADNAAEVIINILNQKK